MPDSMNEKIAFALASCFEKILPPGSVVVSRDSRPSGKDLKRAVISALTLRGRVVLDADLIPLPTTQIAVGETGSAGAIDVTASHNPQEYNGLKFLNSKGMFISQEELENLKKEFSDFEGEIPADFVSGENKLVKNINSEALNWHLEKLKKMIYPGRRLVVAVDAVNGAGSLILPKLLELMDCEVLPIAVNPEEIFPHTPEPTPVNLAWTQEQLAGKEYDLCIVADPDADRLVLIDENGRLLPEEMTVPIVAEELIANGRRGVIVVNMSTSRMIDDVAEKSGVKVLRSAVGELNVVDLMKKEKAFFGGEGNGGVIDPEVHYGRDSLAGTLHVVNNMRRSGKKISEIADGIKRYEMKKVKLPVQSGANLKDIYEKLEAEFPDADADKKDGLKLSWKDKWLHIRPSNTEPILRIMGEAADKEILEPLFLRASKIVA